MSGILGDLLLAIIFAFQIFFINSIAATIALGHIPVISDIDPVIVFFLEPVQLVLSLYSTPHGQTNLSN